MWKEVRIWANSKGYKVNRKPIHGQVNKYLYDWHKESNPNDKGQTNSVFNLAKDIYNSITDYKHVDYQNNYSKAIEHIDYDKPR